MLTEELGLVLAKGLITGNINVNSTFDSSDFPNIVLSRSTIDFY
jgi:hypothetical protein